MAEKDARQAAVSSWVPEIRATTYYRNATGDFVPAWPAPHGEVLKPPA